jgi:hypothetical protein
MTAAADAVLPQPLQPKAAMISWLFRVAAPMDNLSVLGAIVTSADLTPMVRWFRHTFIKIHYILSITGLSSVTIYPPVVAWQALDLGVFVPAANPWYPFLALTGRRGIRSELARWQPLCEE